MVGLIWGELGICAIVGMVLLLSDAAFPKNNILTYFVTFSNVPIYGVLVGIYQ